MTSSLSPAARLDTVRQQISDACERYGRSPSDVNLLAVSKTKPASDVTLALQAGQQHFGENYLQEALDKIGEVSPRPVWHFIGAIQSNKTRPIAENFDWVHTLASAKHARRLNDARPERAGRLKVLVQINIANEASKAGIRPEAALELAGAILECEQLELKGLMAIPPAEVDFERQRSHFRRLADLRAEVSAQLGLTDMNDLSMGMSGDMEAAIAEGSTWLRIGTAIFGARPPKPDAGADGH